MLLVGSKAFLHYTCGGDFGPDRPRDTDYIATIAEAHEFIDGVRAHKVVPSPKGSTLTVFHTGGVTEFMIAWPGTTNATILADEPTEVASLNTLYLLKMSHRYLKHSPHFEKTHSDIMLMRALGAEIEDAGLLREREKETYTYPHPNLNQGKDGFFDPAMLTYTYDHDTIHLAMAIDPLVPAYTKFKGEGEVMVSRAKWEALPLQTKLESVVEEAYVLALERSQIPHRATVAPERSFTIALQRLCSSISSGWWREFAWEHYTAVKGMYDPTYVERFDDAVREGIVKLDTRRAFNEGVAR